MPYFGYARPRAGVPAPFHFVPPDVPPDPAIPPPAIPSTNLTGWTLQTSQDFDINCAEGSFLSAYGGTATSSDILTGKFFATPAGQPDTRFGPGPGVRSGLPGPPPDYGTNDPGIISVNSSVMKIHLYTSPADGVHHIAGPRMKIEGRNASPYSTLGGRYACCWRILTDIPTYKMAWLLWPQSQVWPRDGEIDFPEMGELKSTSHISGFMHWQGGTSGGSQSIAATSDSTNSGWHTEVIEWRPNAASPSLSTLNFIHDGVTVGAYTGTKVPNTVMYWVLQCETFLDYTQPINATANGYIEVAWMAYWTMV